jgi:hypothetical protein
MYYVSSTDMSPNAALVRQLLGLPCEDRACSCVTLSNVCSSMTACLVNDDIALPGRDGEMPAMNNWDDCF